MGYTFFYVPKGLLRLNVLNLGLCIVSLIIYFIFLGLGFDFKNDKFILGITIAVMLLFLGLSLTGIATTAFYENMCRRRDGRVPYLALNRFGSWQEDSFTFAQVIDAIFIVLGLATLAFGIYVFVGFCLR